MKTCVKCKLTKQLMDFHKSKRHSLGVKNECAKCTNTYLKNHYSKRGGRTEEEKRNLTSNHLQRKYNMDLGEYQTLYFSQKGRCLICTKEQKSLLTTRITKGKKEVLVVDHNHSTGKVRGLLCQKCNQGIGLFEENCISLRNAISYITGG